MIVDFSSVNFKIPPTLLICDCAGQPIHMLTSAFNIEAELHYNETSSITFEYPYLADDKSIEIFDALSGMREILWKDVGYFILTNPNETTDGIERIKKCTAYSAEYELTYKQMYLASGTYDFYDPFNDKNTILGMMMEEIPDWTIGDVDADLIGKYRTFDETNDNVYNFIKGNLQDTYQCIFDFDVLHRKINVKSMRSDVPTNPVYLSSKNLVKEIKLEENTEDIFTCLDVSGSDGVTIYSVNPMASSKIYDLSYFMSAENVGESMAKKYKSWEHTYESARLPFFNTMLEQSLEQVRYDTENAKLTQLKGEKSSIEVLLSSYVELDAGGLDDVSDEIKKCNDEIAQKDIEIRNCEDALSDIQSNITEMQSSLEQMRDSVSFSAFFDADEMKIVRKYIKESSIQDSHFVESNVRTYSSNAISSEFDGASLRIEKSSITMCQQDNGNDVYSIVGGNLYLTIDGKVLQTSIVRGAFHRNKDSRSFIFTASINSGIFIDSSSEKSKYNSGCILISGESGVIHYNGKYYEDTGIYEDGSDVSISYISGFWSLTEEETEYQRRSVEWDLFEYGMQKLKSMSWPSYTFSVESCNFLIPEEFHEFKNHLKFGQKIYLDRNGYILEPILIGCTFQFDDPEKISLEFGDKYNAGEARFDLTDLLEQSISAGKSADSNKYNYNSFIDSGASDGLYNFVTGSLNASRNAVISGADQAITIDQSGLRLRKSDGNGGFLKEQIWAINNQIVFTDNNWESAKMAIGHLSDSNFEGKDLWGVIAPSIVGTILAGQNLIIQSAKKAGKQAVFRVDADGAVLHNARFDLVQGNGQITLYPDTGLVGGYSTSSSPLFNYDTNGNIAGLKTEEGNVVSSVKSIDTTDLPNANFWLDMDGNAFFKGTVIAKDGTFSGTLKATKLEGTLVGANGGAIKGVTLGIGGKNYDKFVVDEDGNVKMNGNIQLNGNISWEEPPVQAQFSPDGISGWSSEMRDTDKYRKDSFDGGENWTKPYQFRGSDSQGLEIYPYIHRTWIGPTEIRSPEIKGNNVSVYGSFKTLDASGNTMGFIGAAKGRDYYGRETNGVALASSASIIGNENDGITYATQGNYVIVTGGAGDIKGGCRMQAGNLSLVVTPDTITANDASTGAVVNLLTGLGLTARFG